MSAADKAGKPEARGQPVHSAGPSRQMAGGGFLNSKMTDNHFQRFFLAPFCMDHTCSGSFPLNQLFLPPLPKCDPPLFLQNYRPSSSSLQGSHCTCRGSWHAPGLQHPPGRQSPGSEHLHLNPSCRVGCFALVLALRRTLAAGKAAQERGQGRVTSCGSGDICLGRGLRTRPKATTEATSASTPPEPGAAQLSPFPGLGYPLQTPPGWRLPSMPGGPKGSARPPERGRDGVWEPAALLLSAGAAARHWHTNTRSWKEPAVIAEQPTATRRPAPSHPVPWETACQECPTSALCQR